MKNETKQTDKSNKN